MDLVLVRCSIEANQGGTSYGKDKVDKLGGGKSCSVVYGLTTSFWCEAHGSRATATI